MTDADAAFRPLKDALSTSVEARLAEHVGAFRRGIDLDALASIYEDASGEFEKKIAASVLDHFLGETKTLFGIHQILLESYQLRLVREQGVLSLENLLVQLRDHHSKLVEVSQPHSGFSDFSGGADGAAGCGNE